MTGGFRSTRMLRTGPAETQFPATSQTLRLPVAAVAGSVPAATVVDRLKLASPADASPDPPSPAVQAIETFVECQRVSPAAHDTVGGVASMRQINVAGVVC